MERTIITTLPLGSINPTVYISNLVTVPAAPIRTAFPVLSYLARLIKPEDSIKFILIEKIEPNQESQIRANEENFRKDMEVINETIGAEIEWAPVQSPSSMTTGVHKKLIRDVLCEIEAGSHLICDLTYGTKDVPILEMSIMAAAEKLLGCEIGKFIYGQAIFDKKTKEVVSAYLCDMSPLYSLVNLVNRLESDDPSRGREIIDLLLE